MFNHLATVTMDLHSDLMKIPGDYEQAVEAQVKALAHLNTVATSHEVLRSNVAILVTREGEQAGKKYTLDRIEHGVNVNAEVQESQQVLLAAKIAYEEAATRVKVIENRQKIDHDILGLLSNVVPQLSYKG